VQYQVEKWSAGLFGTAVATMGMLSNAVYILSMNNFSYRGQCRWNRGNVAGVCEVTDRLDAAGSTKAVTKGYSMVRRQWRASCCLVPYGRVFQSTVVTAFTTVNIRDPEVLVGGLIGFMLSFTLLDLLLQQLVERRMVVIASRQFGEPVISPTRPSQTTNDA
jgi:inorganic pyrophosphatase